VSVNDVEQYIYLLIANCVSALLVGNSPFYLLVMKYAVIQLFLHVTELYIKGMCLSISLLLIGLSPTTMLCWMCLSDIQQGQSELLQLTAGDTNQRGVQTAVRKYETSSEDWCNKLCERGFNYFDESDELHRYVKMVVDFHILVLLWNLSNLVCNWNICDLSYAELNGRRVEGE
jgi:hypothetical protein